MVKTAKNNPHEELFFILDGFAMTLFVRAGCGATTAAQPFAFEEESGRQTGKGEQKQDKRDEKNFHGFTSNSIC
jgi:hypothetical protein